MIKSKKSKTKITLKPSAEQQIICDHICYGDNVIVNAVAGSGKSTSILTVANALPKKRFLQITYNSALRKEFKEKVDEEGLTNIEVHTYHSFCVKYFSKDAFTDTGIRNFLYDDDKSSLMNDAPPIPPYDIVVLDESQDMTALYFHLVSYMIHVICGGTKNVSGIKGTRGRGRPHKIQLLVLGDFMQGLYDFKGADIRFLTLAHELWDNYKYLKSHIFHRCTLQMSYRITNQMASFINNVMLGTENKIQACREGCPVIYIRQTPNNIECIVINQILRLLEGGDSPSDIFILGGSVKGANSMVRRIENSLVSKGVPCHVPMIETDGNIDNRVIDGKVVFSTFHSVKGRQRKYVFIVGFDQSYFQFYARGVNNESCPNTLYVGCTRATHMLYLLETKDWSTDRPLTFLKMTHHEMKIQSYIDFRGVPQSIFYELDPQEVAKREAAPIKHYTSPTDLIRFVPETVLEKITPRLRNMFVSLSIDDLIVGDLEGIPSVVHMQTSGLHEDVADLNGIAIPCMYWDIISHGIDGDMSTSVLYRIIQAALQESKENEHLYVKDCFKNIDSTLQPEMSKYLYMANIYVAIQERLLFKLKQIEEVEYNWLSNDIIETCRQRLDTVIGRDGLVDHELTIITHQMEEDHASIDRLLASYTDISIGSNGLPIKYRFKARLDMITEISVWELKCCSQITIDHMLQVIIYAWLCKLLYGAITASKKIKIFNIKTGEVLELVATLDELTEIVVELIRGKYMKPKVLEDHEFINTLRNIHHQF